MVVSEFDNCLSRLDDNIINCFNIYNNFELKNLIKNFEDINDNKINFKLLHMNIRSINKNMDELLIFIDELNNNNCDLDCIILSECWQIHDLIRFNIDGYETFYNNSSYNQNDGVIIFVKTKYRPTVQINNFDFNYNIIRVELCYYNKIIGVTGVYRPSG